MESLRLRARGLSLVLAALVMTLLNCAKPLHIDDSPFYRYAAHIAEEPLAPYSFEIICANEARSAGDLWAPPVLLYWWAGAIRVLGDDPVLWKLSLLPFCLLLSFSLHQLFRRFARHCACSLTWMAMLSPVLLPSLNLMLDVPVLALSLTAVVLFLRAADRQQFWLTVAAGLLAGLAMETKYTAFVTPGVFAAYGLLFQRKTLALVAAALAVGVFVSWETFIALLTGQSHFLHCLGDQQSNPMRKAAQLFLPFVTILGCLSPALILLGLTALKLRGWIVALAAAMVLAGFGWLALVPEGNTLLFRTNGRTGEVHLWHLLYFCWGIALWTVTGAVTWRLLRSPAEDAPPWALLGWRFRRVELFLLLWLVGEVAGYFVLTPFPAARRVIGPTIAIMLLFSRLVGRTCRMPERRQAARRVVFVGVFLGLGFGLIDLRDATATRALVEQAADRLMPAPGRTVWFIGDFAVSFYGPRRGLEPVVLGRTRLLAGDLLLATDFPLQLVPLALDRAPLAALERLEVDDALPLRTTVGFYGGRVPMERRQGPRAGATVYRVTADFTPHKAELTRP